MSPPAILLITGDPEIERAVSEAARKTGRALTVARTAHEAVKQFAHGFQDLSLILVDLDPEVHGVTLFNALDDCHGTVPVVVLTGCEESYMKPLAMSRGAAGCVGKPVTAARFKLLFEDFCQPNKTEPNMITDTQPVRTIRGRIPARECLGQSLVYCVISQRARGLSIGVNMNPDGLCNFDCVYCEVDRSTPGPRSDIDLAQLEREMTTLLDLTVNGTLFRTSPFDSARPDQRRLNDIAFSGDGEPTTAPEFAGAVDCIARIKRERGLDQVKLVLITDSTRLQAPEVIRGLDTMMANQGEIWAKLDAGSEAYYREVNRSKVPFARILDNLAATARRWPITIQTLFLEWRGQGPGPVEVEAYLERLRAILAQGRLQAIQLYTVARPTPEPEARPLRAQAMDDLALRVRAAFPDLPVEVFYGPE